MQAVVWAVVSLLALIGLWTVVTQARAWRAMARRRSAPRLAAADLVLVVRDQAEGIEAFLRLLLGHPLLAGLRLELVAVDSGSRDETPALLQRFALEYPGLRVLRADAQMAADAVTQGLAACRQPVRLVFDLRAPGSLRAAMAVLEAWRQATSVM